MRAMNHPDYQRVPWSDERRAAAAERARKMAPRMKLATSLGLKFADPKIVAVEAFLRGVLAGAGGHPIRFRSALIRIMAG